MVHLIGQCILWAGKYGIKTFTPLKTSSNGSLSALAATFKRHQLPAAAVLPYFKVFFGAYQQMLYRIYLNINGSFFIFHNLKNLGGVGSRTYGCHLLMIHQNTSTI